MSLDFSTETDLRGLARVVHALQVVAEPAGVESVLMGAMTSKARAACWKSFAMNSLGAFDKPLRLHRRS
jgi:hypothetical protein